MQWRRNTLARARATFAGALAFACHSPVLSKVLERVVHTQLSYHLEANNLLPPQQSGFRPGYSLLLKLLSDWMAVIDKGCYVQAVFLDLRKAFDTVDHGILLDNLREIGVNSQTLCWFQKLSRRQSRGTHIIREFLWE